MMDWRESWGHDVHIVNQTSAIGAVNVAAGARERLCRRAQIARAVIDDGSQHLKAQHLRLPLSVPLVDGTAPARRGSISTACRKARPTPLKRDSRTGAFFPP